MKKTDVLGFICLSLFMLCCSVSLDKNYSGYILNNDKPMIKAKVTEEGTGKSTYTDKDGYFTLKRSDLSFIDNLIIQADGENIKDTIELYRGGGYSDPANFLLLNKKNNSLDIHRERFFEVQSGNSKFDYQYYSGYILYNKKPVYNAKVIEGSTGKQAYTFNNGFFYLKRTDPNFVDKLIIQEDGSSDKDTIELLRKGSDGKPYAIYYQNEKDTIDFQYKLDLYEERKAK